MADDQMPHTEQSKGEILVYQGDDGQVKLDVRLEGDTVWLTQRIMADLFGVSVPTINEHLRNIFRDKELRDISVIRKFRITADDGKKYNTNHYNLDAIISVGYRVKSQIATQFRMWATSVLKQHLINGYTLNKQLLATTNQKYLNLQKAVDIVAQGEGTDPESGDETTGILAVISKYSFALDVLDKYDHKQLEFSAEPAEASSPLAYEMAIEQVAIWRAAENAGDLFGNEKDDSFKSSLGTIYQTFGGQQLYPSIEEKAAHLLYFIVKNHSFTDGNKRIAAGLFVYFLSQNEMLYHQDGSKRIDDNALAAMTIMIAASKADEMDTIVKFIVNLIQGKTS